MKAFYENMLIWKLAITRVTIKTFITGAAAIVTGLNGLEWSAFNGTQRVCFILGVFVIMGGTIDAFLDKTIANMSSGKPPLGGDEEKIKL